MEVILKYFPNLPAHMIEQLQLYAERLLWWNAQINLVSRQDTEHLMERHILHSLAIAKAITFPAGSRILDLGTGGGLPGIPLAIYFPQSTFTLIDGTGKKIKAVQSMIADLQLKNTSARHIRVEDVEGEFDFIVSRAVAPLSELYQWVERLFGSGNKEGKGMIVLKGGDLSQEIAEFRKGREKDQNLTITTQSIYEMFPRPYFEEKYLVGVKKGRK